MTLTILASFSLLALVVTARPIVLHDDAEYAYARPSDVESAVQAVFESRNKQAAIEGLDSLEGDIKIHITSPQDQHAYLSQLDTGDVKALIPLGDNGLLSEDEKKLYEMLGGSEAMDDVEGDSRPLDEVRTPKAVSPSVGGEMEVAEEEAVAPPELEAVTSVNAPWYAGPSQPLIVVAFSCALAFVTMLCVGVSLYAYYYVRTQLFSSRTAWDLLPRLEKQGLAPRTAHNGMASIEKPLLEDEKVGLLHTISRAASREQLRDPNNEKVGILIDLDDTAASDDEYLDALDLGLTPRITPADLTPRIPAADLPAVSLANPLMVPLPGSPNAPARSIHGSPAWASRPSSPALNLNPGLRGDVQATDRAPRARIVDWALALQLRPGLGIGADPAWLVRFLMAMFGWLAVLVGGTARTEDRSANRRLVGH